jgi:predicted AlkP superfamily pyrophosphatase or phosphodiesterase
MKKFVLIFSYSLFILCGACAQASRHVVLISVDGFRPDFYLDQEWGMQNLRQMMRQGAYAKEVRGVFPTVTYPSHTTIITGAYPGKHGIYYNSPFEPEGSSGRWYWETSLIRVPTLWDAVHKAGLTSAAILWPVTVGGPIDFNVPEIWKADKTMAKVDPMKENTTPTGLWDDIVTNATGKINQIDLNGDYMGLDENISRMAAYIIKTYKPSFTAIHLACVDEAEHVEGREGASVHRAVVADDYNIGRIMEALTLAGIRDSTTIIITGDHGFADIYCALFPNVWLKSAGIPTSGKEWKARFQATGGSAFLYVRDINDLETIAKVRKIFTDLPANQKKLFRIIDNKELCQLGADSSVYLALSPREGIAMGGNDNGEPLRKWPQKGAHGFLPDYKDLKTGFVAFGNGINQGIVIEQMDLTDIAPIIAKLLGLDFKAPDGILYPGIIKN